MISFFQYIRSTRQFILLSIFLLSTFAMSFAVYLQHVFDENPCPLCILQRYAFFGIIIFTLLALFKKLPLFNRSLFNLFILLLANLSALVGISIAGHQLWLSAHPKVTCGVDTLEPILNNWLPAKWFPNIFAVQGACQSSPEPLLGLSIPTWSIIIFIICFIGLLLVTLAEFKTKRHYFS